MGKFREAIAYYDKELAIKYDKDAVYNKAPSFYWHARQLEAIAPHNKV
jgi:hypothetical protein